jgi:hypothetical protein
MHRNKLKRLNKIRSFPCRERLTGGKVRERGISNALRKYAWARSTNRLWNLIYRPTVLHDTFHGSLHSNGSSLSTVTKYRKSKHASWVSGGFETPVSLENGAWRPSGRELPPGGRAYMRAAMRQKRRPQSNSLSSFLRV